MCRICLVHIALWVNKSFSPAAIFNGLASFSLTRTRYLPFFSHFISIVCANYETSVYVCASEEYSCMYKSQITQNVPKLAFFLLLLRSSTAIYLTHITRPPPIKWIKSEKNTHIHIH